MWLKIDQIVQGRGISNTGNVARFFKNAEKLAKITRVNLNIIMKLGNILISMSS
jgi:hypothetical protein